MGKEGGCSTWRVIVSLPAPDCNPVFFLFFVAFLFVCLFCFSDLVMFTAVQSV